MIELLLDAEKTLALGLLDQAERTYRQVLEADPHNAIAAVGLARVALERGDEAGALALAHEAAALDPDNATARRMIDRMEEVARFRDTRAADPAAPAPSGGAPATEPTTSGVATDRGAPAPSGGAPAPAPGPALPGDTSPPDARPGLLRRLLRRS